MPNNTPLSHMSGLVNKILSSLAIKVGLAIVLLEALIFISIGYIYTRQLDRDAIVAAENRIQIPGQLLKKNHMKHHAVGERNIMYELLGEELLDSMIIRSGGEILVSMKEEEEYRNIQDVQKDFEPGWLEEARRSSKLFRLQTDTRHDLISITPLLLPPDSQNPFSYAYFRLDETKIRERRKKTRNESISLALIGIMLTSLIIFLAFKLMVFNRIRQSIKFVQEVQKGNLDIRLEATRPDELGQLETGLNEMAGDLARRSLRQTEAESKLLIVNETLEQRVEERTAEMSDALNRLKREVLNHTQTGKALRRQSSYIRLLQRITVAANESTTANGALQVCLGTLCKNFSWPIGHVYILNEDDSSQLIHANIWQFDESDSYNFFKQEAVNMRLTLGQGLPGKVLRSGTPIWIENALQDDYKLPETVIDHGLHTAFAFPVILGREVVAVFEFFIEIRPKPEPDFFEVMRDIGTQLGRIIERKRAGDEIRKTMEEADSANRAKSEFLSNFSHALRTPMNAISGYGQMLKIDKENPLNDGQREQLDVILTAGTHLVDLMDQVLDLTRIEAGHYPLDPTRINLADILEECLLIVETLAKSRRVKIKIREPDNFNLALQADPVALKQIVINLLSNAIKYGGSDNPVTVSLETLETGFVRLMVQDRGPGIPEKMLDTIFLPFRRLTASDIEAGTGIGLSLSKQLAVMMQGSMGVRSEENAGSCFWVELPHRL